MPTRRTLLLLVLGGALFAFAGVSTVAAFLALAGSVGVLTLLALDRRCLPAEGDVALTRDCREVFSLGRPNEIAVTLTNRSAHPLRGVLQDNPPASCRREPAQLPVHAPPGSRIEAAYRIVPTERGRFRFSEAVLRAYGPLGLAFRDYVFPDPPPRAAGGRKDNAAFTVYPPLGAATIQQMAAYAHRMESGYHRLFRQIEGTTPSQLRPWAPGDSYRDIHWKATARYDRPMVTQYDTDRNQTVFLFVDCGRLMRTVCPPREDAPRAVPLRRLDHAVHACAELARVAIEQGDSIGLCCFSSEVRVWLDPKGKRGQLLRILDCLADIQADARPTDYDAPINRFLSRTKRRSLCVFLTALSESADSARLMERLHSLRTRHLPAVISLSDPELARALQHDPTTIEEAWFKLAAADLREEADLLAQQIRRHHGHFLEVPADALSASVVGTYLDIKSRGRV